MTDSANDGYSLLEVLVALALTAVIATLMSEVIPQLHPLKQIQTQSDGEEIANRLADVIALDLASTTNLPLAGSDSFQPMIGRRQFIRFVAIARTGFATQGLREVIYQLQASPRGGDKLTRSTALRRFSDGEKSATATADDLYDKVRDIQFAYLHFDAQNRPIWQGNWNISRKLPSAIRISIVINYGRLSMQAVRTVSMLGE